MTNVVLIFYVYIFFFLKLEASVPSASTWKSQDATALAD